jgi:hypothetical protein
MALVDFHQLVVLYSLRRRDAEFISKHSYPPMPTPVLPDPPSTEPRIRSLPPPIFRVPAPRTPIRRQDPATALGLTPVSNGTSIRRKQESDTDEVDRDDRADYENYIREDLSCRVFVDYEVFMKRVLHVPEDWETQWGGAIEAVKANAVFKRHHKNYCKFCEESGTLEKNFYPSLMEMANAVLGVLSRSRFEGIPSGKRQYYYVNDPKHLKGGMMNKKGLSPDLVLLHKDRPHPHRGGNKSLHWANPLHVLEVKPYDNALCDGGNIPRLVVDGKHARWPFRVWLQLMWEQVSIRV